MKILVTPIGSAGDNFPMIGLGAALARRGHNVTVLTCGEFEPQVRACGLEYVEVATAHEYHERTRDPDVFHPRRGFPTVMAYMRDYLQRLMPILRDRVNPAETLIVAAATDFASRSLQDALGVPVVTVNFVPLMMRTVYALPTMSGTTNLSFLPRWMKRSLWWLVDRLMIDPVMNRAIQPMRDELGLPPVQRPMAGWVHSPLLTLGLFPEWFGPPQPDWPSQVRVCGFPRWEPPTEAGLPEAVTRLLADGQRPIVFTPGSANQNAQQFFTAAVDACTRLRRPGLLLSGYAAHIPDSLPAGVVHVPFAPLRKLLPRCGAIVHHGGIGTCAAALASATPQVITPLSHDQPDNAARLLRLGVGRRLLPRQVSGARLAASLRALLESASVRADCDELARRCAAVDGLEVGAEAIEHAVPTLRGKPRAAPPWA